MSKKSFDNLVRTDIRIRALTFYMDAVRQTVGELPPLDELLAMFVSDIHRLADAASEKEKPAN